MERQQRKINGSPLRRSGIGTVRQTDTFPPASRFVIGDWLYALSGDRVTVQAVRWNKDKQEFWYKIVWYSPSGRPTFMWVPETALSDSPPSP